MHDALPDDVDERTVAYAATVGGTAFGLAILIAGEVFKQFAVLVPTGGVVVLLSVGLLVWLVASEPSPHG